MKPSFFVAYLSSKIVATPSWSEKTKVKALPSDFEVVTLWRLEQ